MIANGNAKYGIIAKKKGGSTRAAANARRECLQEKDMNTSNMLKRMFLAVACTPLTTSGGLAASVQILEPKAGAVVPTLTEGQKAYVKMPLAERREKFANATFRSKEMGCPAEKVKGVARQTYWPKTTKLVWKAEGDAGCDVAVVDRQDGQVVFAAKSVTNVVYVDNLKIARTYDWTVALGGETAKSSFVTEDIAPRLIRFPGRVPNVRDIGGRIGLGGRRVKQGLVFRSAGLNDNASAEYYTEAEAKEKGLAFTPETNAVAKLQARLDQLLAWQKHPASIDKADREYKEWCGRHPGEKAEKFIKSRIKRAQGELKSPRRTKHVKRQKPGAFRMTPEQQAETARRFGIRSDIDLRSDGECWGMTGSPLGPSVKWFHCSSSAYGGLQSKGGRESFAKVFRVFLDEKNYPIDFHCIAGQDRTGAVSCILLALLGVEENELYLDWEETGFWNRGNGFCHEKYFDHLIAGFKKNHPAPTIQESIVLYVKSLGFTDEDLAKFRNIMFE